LLVPTLIVKNTKQLKKHKPGVFGAWLHLRLVGAWGIELEIEVETNIVRSPGVSFLLTNESSKCYG
jgi:hypothetical protein